MASADAGGAERGLSWLRSSGGTCLLGRAGRVAVAVLALVALAAAPDPTTGHPPAPSAPAPAFRAEVAGVGPGTRYSLASSWRRGCPVPPRDLRLLRVDHWGFDGRAHRGELVVHRRWTGRLAEVFRRLFRDRFQIERMQPIVAYGGDDDRSMAANNTSAFNCRRVSGSRRWSEHAKGLAVDLNPVQNPYVKESSVAPPAGRAYLDRSAPTPGMIRDGDQVVAAFAAIGWRWGGHWTTAKDYQHFSSTGR